MLKRWKALSYKMKVRLFMLAILVITTDSLNYIANIQAKERTKYLQTISRLEGEVFIYQKELGSLKSEYKGELKTIVAQVYEREFYLMGGYETESGENVKELYAAIMNESKDYHSILSDTQNYFDARRLYISEIPSIWPIEYNEFTCITSGFGYRLSPITGRITFHPGIDISGVWNAKIISTADGKVVSVQYNHPDLGHMIKVLHAGGFETVYGHLSKIFVRSGNTVHRGQIIGIMGDTGKSTGSHLHYEVHRNGMAVNPIDYLQF
jgi:murein DD-endopeptidase MepM/ murein hydrolase activator NlpD